MDIRAVMNWLDTLVQMNMTNTLRMQIVIGITSRQTLLPTPTVCAFVHDSEFSVYCLLPNNERLVFLCQNLLELAR